VLVRPRDRVAAAMPAVAATIRSVAPGLPYVNVQTLEDLANVQARSWRLGATLFGLFGVLAVVLAATGIYATLAFAVRQRTTEIGIRLALGAAPREISGMVVRQGLRLVATGWLLGMADVLLPDREWPRSRREPGGPAGRTEAGARRRPAEDSTGHQASR